MTYYHTKPTDIGNTVTMKNGGYYEKVHPETGCPQLQYAGGGPIGFAIADTPAISGSVSPEASLFAVLFNTKQTGEYHIYETSKEPDLDISNCGHDFGIMEEVRWENPAETPIEFTKHTSVCVPRHAIKDILYAYLGNPHNPNILWAEQIKNGLSDLIDGNEYPTQLWEQWDKEPVFQPGFIPDGPSSTTLTKDGYLKEDTPQRPPHG